MPICVQFSTQLVPHLLGRCLPCWAMLLGLQTCPYAGHFWARLPRKHVFGCASQLASLCCVADAPPWPFGRQPDNDHALRRGTTRVMHGIEQRTMRITALCRCQYLYGDVKRAALAVWPSSEPQWSAQHIATFSPSHNSGQFGVWESTGASGHLSFATLTLSSPAQKLPFRFGPNLLLLT